MQKIMDTLDEINTRLVLIEEAVVINTRERSPPKRRDRFVRPRSPSPIVSRRRSRSPSPQLPKRERYDNDKCVLVKKVSKDMTAKELHDIFSAYGKVQKAFPPWSYGSETVSRVVFETFEGYEKCMEEVENILKDHALECSQYDPQQYERRRKRN